MTKGGFLYLLILFFNLFPSYSPSIYFSDIFIQPRYFAIPFLIIALKTLKINAQVKIHFSLLIISLLVPIFGFIFGRTFSLLDVALVVNWVYLLLFYGLTMNNQELFHRFLAFFLWLNLAYIAYQLAVYYAGFPEFTMIHSNVPFHVESEYAIQPYFFSWLPRYSGLFIESGPLVLFLCFSYLFIIQFGRAYSSILKVAILVAIVLSQSKYLILFLPFLIVEYFLIDKFNKIYRIMVSPFVLSLVLSGFGVLLFVVFSYSELNAYFVENLISYDIRLEAIKKSVAGFSELGPFGNYYRGTNFSTDGEDGSLAAWDIFSVLFHGYGVFFGSIIVFLITLTVIISSIDYKFTFIATLILAFLAGGSLLVPQYTFFMIYCGILHTRFSDKKN